jgi:hypothetical protein
MREVYIKGPGLREFMFMQKLLVMLRLFDVAGVIYVYEYECEWKSIL